MRRLGLLELMLGPLNLSQQFYQEQFRALEEGVDIVVGALRKGSKVQ